MKDKIRIAIDGPSGAGKSTIAKKVAASLHIDYVDTGAMYRAVALKTLREGIDIQDGESLKHMLEKTEIDFSQGHIVLDGKQVNHEIRTPEVTRQSSYCSALSQVRGKLVSLQRSMGEAKSIIMDGRDIGTNVLIDAEYKFFLTASTRERALRRWKELQQRGENISLDKVEQDLIKRDHDDSVRALNPLRKADDAIEIDSTGMTIDQVAALILNRINSR